MPDQSNFVISTRNIFTDNEGEKQFGSKPGKTRYLEVPAKQNEEDDPVIATPSHANLPRKEWIEKLLDRAGPEGDILIFVHGYNNSIEDVMFRHDELQEKLRAQGFEGAIVSFDWPSGETTLGYLKDRHNAYQTASRLVTDGIVVLARYQRDQFKRKCDIDVHLLCHSTGAYVVREAFYKADQEKELDPINWNVSQIALIGADIGAKELDVDDHKSQALFAHSIRITNYQNPFDSALKISNVKRLGFASRVGRVGASDKRHAKVVNVDVGNYWDKHIAPLEDDAIRGGNSHSWHFQDSYFARDLALTIKGDIDRHRIPTRETIEGKLHLRAPE